MTSLTFRGYPLPRKYHDVRREHDGKTAVEEYSSECHVFKHETENTCDDKAADNGQDLVFLTPGLPLTLWAALYTTESLRLVGF